MEDLIYIILAIVWIVVGIVGANKKKKAQAPQQAKPVEAQQEPEYQPQPQPARGLEAMIEDIFEKNSPIEETEASLETLSESLEEYIEPEEYKFEYPETVYPENKYDQFSQGYKMDQDYEFGSQDFESIEDMIKMLEKEDESRPEVVDLDSSDQMSNSDIIDSDYLSEFVNNPKKAIIYSEIINRRY